MAGTGIDGGRAIENAVEIPDKLYFKIGEVSEISGVEPHVLRYWEGEFPLIRPQRAGSKQRLFRRVDVEYILRIKHLLYVEGFTIAGARKALARDNGTTASVPPPAGGEGSLLKGIKSELAALKTLLEKD